MRINKQEVPTTYIILGLAIVGIVLYFFVSCGGNSKPKEEGKYNSSILNSSTTTSFKPRTTTSYNPNTTLPPYDKAPFSAEAQRNFYSLATTGEYDYMSPGSYTSPRWEAIIGGDTSSGVPLSQLDDPKNSDLNETTFNAARTTAIAITRAQITGEGSNSWPNYFNENNTPGTCTSFILKNAGATSLPVPNDNRWIIAVVFWKASCSTPNGGSYKVEQQTQVYFTVENGVLVPQPYSKLPTK